MNLPIRAGLYLCTSSVDPLLKTILFQMRKGWLLNMVRIVFIAFFGVKKMIESGEREREEEEGKNSNSNNIL